jgi:F-type H+-transporting ATPase subunit b
MVAHASTRAVSAFVPTSVPCAAPNVARNGDAARRNACATILVLLLAVFAAICPAQESAPKQPPPSTGEHAVAEAGQHEAAKGEHGAGEAEEGNLDVWKWANFIILAGILGWMISKSAPSFFRNRTEQIQKGIAEAAKIKQEADARAAKMELRMSQLQTEVEGIRSEAKANILAEADRIRKATEQQMARIKAQSEREIESMTKHAEQELRAYSAQLAVQLAEQRIRTRIDGDSQNALFNGFIRQLDSKAKAASEVRQ